MSPVARLLPYTVLIAVCHPSVDITINSPQPPPSTLAILVTEREAVCVFCHHTHALYFHQTLSIKSCVDDSTRSTLDPTIHTVGPSVFKLLLAPLTSVIVHQHVAFIFMYIRIFHFEATILPFVARFYQ